MERRVEAGAVFVGCARNCAKHWQGVSENIEGLARMFARSSFVFVENDSTDTTKDVVQGWLDKHATGRLIARDGLHAACPVRTIRLAEARNAYLRHVRRELRDFDYLIVLDCDEVNERPIDRNSFLRAVDFLAGDPLRAGVFANQLGTYYDMWALRHSRLCPHDVWEEVLDHVTRFGGSDLAAYGETLGKRVFSLRPDAPPLEVNSAFGGLGIYKMPSVMRNPVPYLGYKKKILRSREGATEVGLQVCEHVSFNDGFRRNGEKLFVLPFLINWECGRLAFPPSAYRSKTFDLSHMPAMLRERGQAAKLLQRLRKLVRSEQ